MKRLMVLTILIVLVIPITALCQNESAGKPEQLAKCKDDLAAQKQKSTRSTAKSTRTNRVSTPAKLPADLAPEPQKVVVEVKLDPLAYRSPAPVSSSAKAEETAAQSLDALRQLVDDQKQNGRILEQIAKLQAEQNDLQRTQNGFSQNLVRLQADSNNQQRSMNNKLLGIEIFTGITAGTGIYGDIQLHHVAKRATGVTINTSQSQSQVSP